MTPKDAADYRWSSLNRFVHGGPPDWLIAADLLSEARDLPDTRVGWRKYCRYLTRFAVDETAQRTRSFQRMCQGWSVGAGDFKLAMQQKLLEQGGNAGKISMLGSESKDVRELREMMLEEKLKEEAARLDIDLDHLPPKKSAPEKVQLAVIMKATTSVSNGWLASRLQMGKSATVSQYIRHFQLAVDK